jgi:hypothetical protein
MEKNKVVKSLVLTVSVVVLVLDIGSNWFILSVGVGVRHLQGLG